MFFSKLDIPAILGLIAFTFAFMKLTGELDWPWLVVLAPLWFPPVFVLGGGLLLLAVIFIAAWIIHAIERYT